jgi:hypothetical protein
MIGTEDIGSDGDIGDRANAAYAVEGEQTIEQFPAAQLAVVGIESKSLPPRNRLAITMSSGSLRSASNMAERMPSSS